MIDIPKLIQTANSMAPLPASAVRLASIVNNPDAGIDEIADVVTFDQALTVKLLRLANSAASGSATRVTDVKEAVMRMGAAQVLSFAVASHAQTLLNKPVRSFALSEDQLWRHSVRAALAVELMPRIWRMPVPPAAFAAALLHDIGKLVMDRLISSADAEALRVARGHSGIDALHAELEVLEVNHAEVGGIVAQHWSLPEDIVRGIIYHHQPERVGDEVTDVVYLANLAAHHRVPAEGEPPPLPLSIDEGVAERRGVDAAMIAALGEALEERFDEVFSRYSDQSR